MPEHRLHNTVYAALEEIAAAEKITRAKLAEMSRDLLIYVPDTDDIDIVNRLLGVLTPMNRKVAILYFGHFLPWDAEQDNDGVFTRFGKRHKGAKKVKKKLDAITEWLSDDANNIWVWGEDNIEIKKKDFKATVSRAIKKALEGDEKSDTDPLTREELMDAIFEGGVTLDDMLQGVEKMQTAQAEAAEKYLEADTDNQDAGDDTDTPADVSMAA